MRVNGALRTRQKLPLRQGLTLRGPRPRRRGKQESAINSDRCLPPPVWHDLGMVKPVAACALGDVHAFNGEKTMRLRAGIAVLAVLLGTGVSAPADAASRIKDLASVEGVRQNQLIGYGL